jgi:hypothetical protein
MSDCGSSIDPATAKPLEGSIIREKSVCRTTLLINFPEHVQKLLNKLILYLDFLHKD